MLAENLRLEIHPVGKTKEAMMQRVADSRRRLRMPL